MKPITKRVVRPTFAVMAVMMMMRRYLLLIVILSAAGCDEDMPTAPTGPNVSFFVTSATSATGNLGGLSGADQTCQRLAVAAGHGTRTWRAYLSVERDPSNANQPTHARDRIGAGPWYNANLTLVANNLAELHSRTGDAVVFVDERGGRVNGQWTGSPSPVQHDILTGSNADGTVAATLTCSDWTSASTTVAAQVGHSDGMGPNQSTCRGPLVLELLAHERKLRGHRAPRRRRALLLLRPVGEAL